MKRGALVLAALLATTLPSRAAHADPVDDARALFVEGSALLHAGRPEDALEKLQRSFALVPSPNTELLLGRALRELGRRVEAAGALEHAEAEARRRGNAGETKYGQTEAAAHAEAASLRAQLGRLRIRIAEPARASLRIDGKAVPIAAEGETTVLHEPGRIEVAVSREGEAESRQIVEVSAGAAAQMEFASASARPPKPVVVVTPARVVASSRATWALPAAIVAGGVTVVGAGVFTVFGLKSGSAYDDLEARCGPACGPAERANADAGSRDQTIANVGLAVGSLAAAAAITFVLVHVLGGDRTASPIARTRSPTL